jgi:catechol 2,3-dioxygenase-like lactoylglutathione lyase family enzyme
MLASNMQIHHINIKGPPEMLEQEKRFFCEVLGLSEGMRPNLSSKGYWLYSGDQAIVHLSESKVHLKNEQQGFFDHVAFQSSGLKKLVQVLENMKIKYSTGYVAEQDMTQVFFKAPSDTGIEVNFINEKI